MRAVMLSTARPHARQMTVGSGTSCLVFRDEAERLAFMD